MLKMKCLLFIIVAMLLCSTSTSTQTRPNKGRAPKFSSVYTDTTKCPCSDHHHAAYMCYCKGYGGYKALRSYPAMSQGLYIETKDGTIVTVERQNKPPRKTIGGKIEWRLANGKPFAIIVRFSYYSGDDYEKPYDNKYRAGEVLFVKGLKGYEKIEFEVDTKTLKANEKARELADNAFLQGS